MSKKIISGYRKKIRLLLNKIEHSSFSVAFTDPLIKGTPGKVYCKFRSKPISDSGSNRSVIPVQTDQ